MERRQKYVAMAELIASKLTTRELERLALLLEEDSRDDFNQCIQEKVAMVSSHLFGEAPDEGNG